ncbi:MAG: GNAT family N-acetyltransferase [archaeon]|nr:GNAT family N-acetyltransferase [archaeon]
MPFQIKLLTDTREIMPLYEFIRQFPLDYPDYSLWLKKCKRELELMYKKAFYATNDAGIIAGSAIFQRHKQEHSILEIKNLRVSPEFERNGLGSILIDSVEQFAREFRFKRMQCDAHPENPAIKFLEKRGFSINAEETLYSIGNEIILCKDIQNGTSGNPIKN